MGLGDEGGEQSEEYGGRHIARRENEAAGIDGRQGDCDGGEDGRAGTDVDRGEREGQREEKVIAIAIHYFLWRNADKQVRQVAVMVRKLPWCAMSQRSQSTFWASIIRNVARFRLLF